MDVGSDRAPGRGRRSRRDAAVRAAPPKRAADRGRRREQERAEEAERRRHAQELRACYVALNTSGPPVLRPPLTDQAHAPGPGRGAADRATIASRRPGPVPTYAGGPDADARPGARPRGWPQPRPGTVYGMRPAPGRRRPPRR
ncbi:hypothetical protein LT493_17855 [Streptomyces tricolor]|nr:hypothetical protein [Streptomyces tricolor]